MGNLYPQDNIIQNKNASNGMQKELVRCPYEL